MADNSAIPPRTRGFCSPATAATSSWRPRSSTRSTVTMPESVRRFLLDVADGEAAVRSMAESVVREVVGRRELLDLLTGGRREAEDAAVELLRARLAAYRFGIAVRRVSFQDIHPPLAVLDAYRDVSRANSDRQRRINEANAYRDQVVTEAHGKSRSLRNGAEASRSRQLALAAGAADRFEALREARQYAPALTDFRLFWKTVAEALAGKDKLISRRRPGPSSTLGDAGPPLGSDGASNSPG